MNMIDDVKEFKRLSISYRESHDDIDKQNKIERDIKFLVDGTVQRMSESFGITLNQEVKKIERNTRGTFMPSHTYQQIQSRPHIRVQDFMYLHKKSIPKMNGINIMLDYSGSEWWNSKSDTIEDVLRIYIQNFLALCLAKYMQDTSKDEVRIVIHAFGRFPIKILDTYDIENTSCEGLFVHDDLTRTFFSGGGTELLPNAFNNLHPTFTTDNWRDFFNGARIKDAFDVSLNEFKKMNMDKFVTLLLTDGGICEFGYGGEDAIKFTEKSIIRMEQHSNKSKLSFVFIKTQVPRIKDIVDKMGISSVEILKKSDYNNAFLNVSNLINSIVQ